MTLTPHPKQLLSLCMAHKIQPLGRIFLFSFCLVVCAAQVAAQRSEFRIEHKKGKAGITYVQIEQNNINYTEKWILDPGYDSIRMTGEFIERNRYKKDYPDSVCNFFLLYKKGKVGLFAAGRSKGWDGFKYKVVPNTHRYIQSSVFREHIVAVSMVLPCNYTDAKYLGEANFSFKENEKWKVFNGFSEQWTDMEFDEIVLKGAELSYARKNGKLGIYSVGENKWILNPAYDFISNPDDPKLRYSAGLFLVGSAGKMGVFSYEYEYGSLSNKSATWKIEANRYDKIYPTNPSSNFLLTDSMGKSGVWQYKGNSIWQMAEANFTNIKYDKPTGLVHLEKDGSKNILSQNGWLSRNKGTDNNYSKTLSVYRTNVTVEYYKGKGFELVSNCKPATVTLSIPDKTLYDSVAFDGSLLWGYQKDKLSVHLIHYNLLGYPGYFEFINEKSNKYDNGLTPLSSQLLFDAADSCVSFSTLQDFDNLIKFRSLSILYKKTNKWKLLVLTKAENVKVSPVQSELSFNNWLPPLKDYGLMLVSANNKWGIISSDGNVIVGINHLSYKMIDNMTLLLRSPQGDQWQYFSCKERKVREFLHENKIRVDFNSREPFEGNEVLIVDGKRYFIHNGYTKTTKTEWYTSESKANTGVTKDVIGEFTSHNTRYFIRRTTTGVGVYRQDREILPPYLHDASIVLDKENPSKMFSKLILSGGLHSVSFPANDLERDFNPANFIAWIEKSFCKECNGKGGEYVTNTQIIAGETRTKITKTTNFNTTYDKVFDPMSRSYKYVQIIKPSTSYDVKTEKISDRKETSTNFATCSFCEGRGYLKDIKYRCKIGIQGLDVGEMIVEDKKKKN